MIRRVLGTRTHSSMGKSQKSMSPPRAAKTKAVTPEKVLLYYPNLIGYARVLCMIGAFYFFLTEWKKTAIMYLLAFTGDALDGFVARAFNQSSSFGGNLDMVTDRVSTAGFMFLLSHLYPRWTFTFVMLVCLDIGSHWVHVVSIIMLGNDKHHKSPEMLKKRNWLLQTYYGVYPFFGYCCVGCELFYILLYVHYWNPTSDLVWKLCIYGCLPACVFKNAVNIAQLASACYSIAEVDAAKIPSKESGKATTQAATSTTPQSRGRSTSRKR